MAAETISRLVEHNSSAIAAAVADIGLRARIQPELVMPGELRAHHAYRRFQDLPEKERFRTALRTTLGDVWTKEYGPGAEQLLSQFQALSKELKNSGAVLLAGLLEPDRMSALIDRYDLVMRQSGTESLLHSYANIAEPPDLLRGELGQALHPLLLALVADAVGGAIRLVDGRAKDTGPFEVRAQDNMLHVDNTPFNDEYKLIWLWQKGAVKGPAGQNFTYLPGTHRAARNCLLSEEGEPYSTENASVFVTEDSLAAVAELQKTLAGASAATLVEVTDPQPLAVAFAAGSLVHHRYRTASGLPRSCMILAFHRAASDRAPLSGMLPAAERLIDQVLAGSWAAGTDVAFLNALANEAPTIADSLLMLREGSRARHVVPQPIRLDDEAARRWFRTVTSAPEVEDLKRNRTIRAPGCPASPSSWAAFLARERMYYDKHGPLDLILYADSREEARKAMRNRIREMAAEEMERRLGKWCRHVAAPQLLHIRSSAEIRAAAMDIAAQAGRSVRAGTPAGRLLSSLERLANDLAEAVSRPYSLQNFLSTSLFIFWSADALVELGAAEFTEAAASGTLLLRHYIALAELTDWQLAAGTRN